MHELAVCQALIQQVQRVASEQRAQRVCSITVKVGPLSGVEPELLEQAYSIARAGTVADAAALLLEQAPVRVHCDKCETEAEVSTTRLACPHCGNWRTTLLAGDELVLARVEVERAPELH